jgi:hypothetical protein
VPSTKTPPASATADASSRPLPSIKPALTVVAVAIAIVVLGSVVALIGSPSAHPSSLHPSLRRLAGSKLEAEPAKSFIAHVAAGGEPPANIVSSLAVPAGSRYLSRRSESRGLSQFDSSIEIMVPASEAEVKSFFVRLLSDEHWVTNSITAPAPGKSEVIAVRSGTDGYQWRVGIVSEGLGSLVAPALGGGGSSPARTRVTIRLYQVEDAS